MKITKTQLKRIIKEEIGKVLEGESLSIDATEIKRHQFPKGETSFDDEPDVVPLIQQVVGDLEISDPTGTAPARWDRNKDQIVYLGSVTDRGGQKVAYFKTSNTHRYYMLPV